MPDSDAKEQFWATAERLLPQLVAYARKQFRVSDHDAEDIVHEAIYRAFKRLDRALGRRSEQFDFELYIRSRVYYSALDFIKAETRRREQIVDIAEMPHQLLVDDSYRDLPDELTQGDERNIQRFWQTLEEVLPSERHRKVLLLSTEDYDLSDIAAQLGISHDNARRLKSDAIERLSVSTVFCQACRNLGYQHLPPEWLVGEQLELAFAAVRRRTKAQPSQVSNSVEVRTVQESTVRSFWMTVDSCLDNDTDRLLIRLVLGDDCLAIEQAAKVLCLNTTTAKRRFSQAFKRLRCSEKLYEFCKRNELIPTAIEEVE